MSDPLGRREFLQVAAAGAAASLVPPSPPSAKQLIEMLRRMRKIRHFEERLTGLYKYESYLSKTDLAGDMYDVDSKGLIAGAVHSTSARRRWPSASARRYGRRLPDQLPPRPRPRHRQGRRVGPHDGRANGPQHRLQQGLRRLHAHLRQRAGLLGGNGIVGAQIPLAIGAAFSAKYRDSGQVAVAFFGEGASNQGTFHEALNMAALWELPVIFACENNLYAASTPAVIALAIPNVADRAAGYGMPGQVVDGQDVLAVRSAAEAAAQRARAGGGPTLLEFKTYRFTSHAGAGQGQHNNPEELKKWLLRDPITLF